MDETKMDSYKLSNGESICSLIPYSSPVSEYSAAFQNREQPFLNYYAFRDGEVIKYSLTRGAFWTLAHKAANHLNENGIKKGDRLVHCFSSNHIYDLVFRLAAVFIGCTPVTINWQADTNETIVYKAKVTDAKMIVYDKEFSARLEVIKSELSHVSYLEAERIKQLDHGDQLLFPQLSYDDEKIIVFTSGTIGKPKGVSLSHRSYLANKLTFEQYFNLSDSMSVDCILVNPLHHANSTAFSDWCMRRGGAIIHLIQRYSTAYWKILVDVAHHKRDILIAPIVSRHIDFLDTLVSESRLPGTFDEITSALGQTDILIGSAPVGPKVVERVLQFSGHLPMVRFGSTETCLEVMATPKTLSHSDLMKSFDKGWSHFLDGERMSGYYIGREHLPITQVKVIKSVDPGHSDYFHPCEVGEPGYLITKGPNIMSHYIGDPNATEAIFKEGWYTGLRDIVFTLKNDKDGELDYYWMSRDSELLIRGGANYAYEQLAAELSKVLTEDFQLAPEHFKLAVIGLRVESEHEDSCCVTIELSKEVTTIQPQLEADFQKVTQNKVSKAARPDFIRFAKIPTSFKGTILVTELKKDFKKCLTEEGRVLYE